MTNGKMLQEYFKRTGTFYRHLAKAMGVHWATIQRWSTDKTKDIGLRHAKKLEELTGIRWIVKGDK